MAVPRVFISSTCYDLKHIRESLKYFVKNIGYEPVLSDEGDVFYNPLSHTHDSCLDEVSNCQIFVLIIGGRYGGIHQHSTESITNEEYRIAVSNNIPVFTLVDASVSADHHLYQMNSKNDLIDRDKVKYPASDNVKIFHFINEVRKNSVNNAIYPFNNFLDIENYLKKQWAGMLFDFLLKSKNEQQTEITNKLLSDLSQASRKTEELLKFVYSKLDEANAEAVINNVSDKINAEKFVNLVLNMTGGNIIESTTIDRLLSTPMNGTWFDYLIQSADFYVEDEYDGESDTVYRVLWPLTDKRQGRVLAETDEENVMEDCENEEFQQSFDSLKTLDSETQRTILTPLVAG